jgi:tRNA (adenine57-N1/adenine58-N1)-methyltransferase catalytic subunit
MTSPGNLVQPGDLVLLIDGKGNTFIILVQTGEQLHTHRGILEHDNLIGHPWGIQAKTHTGYGFLVLSPSLGDLLLRMRRNTQIMYPKEIGFILVNMGIGPGKTVIEAGTGSGALTTALAYMVGPTGRVYSYETRPEMQDIAIKNLEKLGLDQNVKFKLKDINQGFDESGVDALFLDVPNPEDYILQVRDALAPGKPFGSLLPTTNQVSRLIKTLQENQFGFIEVCEILLRYYKPVPDRLRPVDRMTGHTGFLIFARPLLEPVPEKKLDIDSDQEQQMEKF